MYGIPYDEQLRRKREAVASAFAGHGMRIRVEEVEGMPDPFNYRNKVIANVSMRSGRLTYGMYEENTHKVTYAPDCFLQNRVLNGILKTIKEEADRMHISAYGHGGVLKQVLLRTGVSTGQVMVVFVTSDDMFHGRAELVKRITARHPEIRTVIQNTNPRQTSVVLGERERVLYGPGYITDSILGIKFKISARSFYQVNPFQTGKLYERAIGLAEIKGTDTVLDTYCGIGTIGLCAASQAGRIVGVEINRDAVRDAVGNARYNGIRNAVFYCEDAKDFMRDYDERIDVLVTDPPRSGCGPAFLAAVKRLKPGRIVYISCNPETQAADIALLSDMYTCDRSWPFDMFPHTAHVESVCLLNARR